MLGLMPGMTGQFWCSVGSAIRPMAGLGHEPALLPMGGNGGCGSIAAGQPGLNERLLIPLASREADRPLTANSGQIQPVRSAPTVAVQPIGVGSQQRTLPWQADGMFSEDVRNADPCDVARRSAPG